MNSLNYCGKMLENIIKASNAAKSANDVVVSLEEDVIKFFNATYKEVEELENQLSDWQTKITDKEHEIVELKGKIYENEAVISSQKEEIDKLTTALSDKDKDIRILTARVNDETDDNHRKLMELSSLRKELQEAIADRDVLSNKVTALENGITALTNKCRCTE